MNEEGQQTSIGSKRTRKKKKRKATEEVEHDSCRGVEERNLNWNEASIIAKDRTKCNKKTVNEILHVFIPNG